MIVTAVDSGRVATAVAWEWVFHPAATHYHHHHPLLVHLETPLLGQEWCKSGVPSEGLIVGERNDFGAQAHQVQQYAIDAIF